MGATLRIYLDACAINRLSDPPTQHRIALETAAMERLLRAARTGQLCWIASSVLLVEIENNPDQQRRSSALALLRFPSEVHRPTALSAERGRQLNLVGYGKLDALHLAMAEEHSCDLLLTTDDRFLRRAMRNLGKPSVRVENPLNYWKEVRL
jgi:predicted nucleic acid-binding protein